MNYIAIAALTILLSYFWGRIWFTFGSIPKVFVLSSPTSIWQIFSINVKPLMWDREWQWKEGYTLFQRMGSEVISVLSLRLFQGHELLISDPILIKHILQDRNTFIKPGGLGRRAIESLGPSIFSTEGDQWKRHKRITGPAFNDKHHRLVWQAACDITLALFEKWTKETNGQDVVVENFDDITVQLTLKVFCHAGFNIPSTWDSSIVPPVGHEMGFEETLSQGLRYLLESYLVPHWILRLSNHGREVLKATKGLHLYLDELMEERAAVLDDQQKGNDLLSFLVDAGVGRNPNDGLTQREITGNIFVFLVAGHDTTAHTLAFTFARLALHRDEQDALYEHICSVIPEGRMPKYEDVPKLTRVLAVLYETLRLHPIIGGNHKVAAMDCTVQSSAGPIAIPKGTRLHLDMPGTHLNPTYWEDPHEYRPSRFLEDYNKDAFIPFSHGARACIGRRFAEIESLAVISLILLNYSIEVTEEPQFAGETSEERAKRVLDWHTPVFLTPKKVPLTFKPRKSNIL